MLVRFDKRYNTDEICALKMRRISDSTMAERTIRRGKKFTLTTKMMEIIDDINDLPVSIMFCLEFVHIRQCIFNRTSHDMITYD